MTAGRSARWSRRLRDLAVLAVLAALLWWALRGVPLPAIWVALRGLRAGEIALLLAINAVVVCLMAARWWLVVRAEQPRVPFLPLVGYRLAAFGLSYFTPGPQVGGEPLQVLYLQRNHALSFARATASVIMDKLLEFLVNFVLLALGAWAVFRVGLVRGGGPGLALSLAGLGLVLSWPLVHVALLYAGQTPVAALLRRLPFLPPDSRALRLATVSERLASAFCRRHLRVLIAATAVSLLSVAGILAEYALMLAFLGIRLDPVRTVAALTALQLAFLMPLPGGLGAMEASQVFALGAFGQPAAAAIALTLLQRARDLLNGGLGLLLAATLLRRGPRGKRGALDAPNVV